MAQQQQPNLACPNPRRGARPDILPRLPDDDQFAHGQRERGRRICRFASIMCAVTSHVFVWLWNPGAEPHGPAHNTQRIAP